MADFSHLAFGTDRDFADGGHIELELERGVSLDNTVLDPDRCCPPSHFYGLVRQYHLPSGTSADTLARDLDEGGALSSLLQRILDGGSTYRDHGYNLRASLDDDATEAERELETLLAGYEGGSGLAVWTAEEWLALHSDASILDTAELTPDSTDNEVSAATATLVAEAERDDAVVWHDDLEALLTRVRDRVKARQVEEDEEDEDEEEEVAA